jgi:hypothetical protein
MVSRTKDALMATQDARPVDPASNAIRYSLDYLAYLANQERTELLHVASPDDVMVEAIIRRFPRRVKVSTTYPDVAQAVSSRLDRAVDAAPGADADTMIVPFAAMEWPTVPAVPHTLVAEYNAFSYKWLLEPGRIKTTANGVIDWMKQRGSVTERVGVMGPDFIVLWALVELIGHRRSDWHFRLRDLAMQHIFRRGWLWRTGYVVIIGGHAR